MRFRVGAEADYRPDVEAGVTLGSDRHLLLVLSECPNGSGQTTASTRKRRCSTALPRRGRPERSIHAIGALLLGALSLGAATVLDRQRGDPRRSRRAGAYRPCAGAGKHARRRSAASAA